MSDLTDLERALFWLESMAKGDGYLRPEPNAQIILDHIEFLEL